MNQFTSLIALSLIVLCGCSDYVEPKTGWERQGLKGKVKSIVTTTFGGNPENRLVSEELEFDINGNVLWSRETDFQGGDSVVTTSYFEYDKCNEPTKVFVQNSMNQHITHKEYVYTNGCRINRIIELRDSIETVTTFSYNDHGQVISEKRDARENDNFSWILSAYNSDNQLIEEISVGRDSISVRRKTRFEYDSNGFKSKETTYRAYKDQSWSIEYVNDEQGNIVFAYPNDRDTVHINLERDEHGNTIEWSEWWNENYSAGEKAVIKYF